MAGFPGRQGREVDLVYKSLGRRIPREKKFMLPLSVSNPVRIDLALLDPYPYWECGSGSRSKETG
jgi:hypothetical protein